jgi:cytoskeletal protein CcmA (bactofilin family)
MFLKTSGKAPRIMPTIVSTDASITGNIAAEGDMQVEGKVVGDVMCHSLSIGPTARVEGRIDCDTIHVHGAVSGEIHAETVFVSITGHVEGDIHHDAVSIESGARVEGQLIRREAKAAKLNLVTEQATT